MTIMAIDVQGGDRIRTGRRVWVEVLGRARATRSHVALLTSDGCIWLRWLERVVVRRTR